MKAKAALECLQENSVRGRNVAEKQVQDHEESGMLYCPRSLDIFINATLLGVRYGGT